jgi:hypothetical protein
MSLSASIDLQLAVSNRPRLSGVEIIQSFLAFGWTLNDDGGVSYLPIGDDDEFDWQTANINHDEILEIIKKKEMLGELIGISMTWGKSGIGGDFLLRSNGSISVILSTNLKRDIETGLIDVNWYISKIITPLSKLVGIESLRYNEIWS